LKSERVGKRENAATNSREEWKMNHWVEPLGIYETHLHVRDLKTSVAFYRDQLGLTLCYTEPKRNLAFFWVGQARQQCLGLWEKPADQIVRSHFAFSVSLRDLEQAPPFLAERGIAYRDFFGNPGGEPTVHTWVPNASLYFETPTGTVWSLSHCYRKDRSPIWERSRSADGGNCIIKPVNRG
jgi:lactoylglutathione lyase